MNSEVLEAITGLANAADVLIFGEIHGTQEVPQLVSHLLDPLQVEGYGALGLEIPNVEQESLRKWAAGESQTPPSFFARPVGDGRGNEQVLDLVRQAIGMGWFVVCFDPGIAGSWRERDRLMAENLLVEVVFHQGAFFNEKVKRLHGKPITKAYISDDLLDGYSLSLHLPKATPATHLTKPVPFRVFPHLITFVQTKVQDWMSKSKPN